MPEDTSKQRQPPTPEDLAGITVFVDGEEKCVTRRKQIPPQEIESPGEDNGKPQPEQLNEVSVFVNGAEKVFVPKPA